jgi:serine/threonine protein kinase
MEYVEGFEPADQPSLEYGQRARILRDVCDAIGHAHALGIQHRDLKPSNIMLDASLCRDSRLRAQQRRPSSGHFGVRSTTWRPNSSIGPNRSMRAPTCMRSASFSTSCSAAHPLSRGWTSDRAGGDWPINLPIEAIRAA